MSETPLDQQDRRMPEPSLIEWLRNQQRIFDEGGASKDRRPELAATLLERVIRQRDEGTLEVCTLKKNCQCCRDALSAARDVILNAGGIEDRISPENELRAEITKLTSQLEEARAEISRIPKLELAFLDAVFTSQEKDRLTARIEELEKALKPFVEYAQQYRQSTLDIICSGPDGCVITRDDLRFASSTLEAGSK